MRVYDPRLGRFLSVDPLTQDFPWYTPYQFAGNKPIWAIDLDGAEELIPVFGMEPPMFSNASEILETGADVGGKTSFEWASGSSPFGEITAVERIAIPQELPFNWSSFDVMPILPRPQSYTYGRGPLLKAPNENTITQQVPEKSPQPTANPQRQYDPKKTPEKEDNGDDGYYLYETAGSDKINSGIVTGKSAIAYFGITKTAFERNGSIPGRYDPKHERVKNLVTIHGKANAYTIKGAETAIIELNSKGTDIKYTTRIDNKSRSTSDRARINAGIKWLRENFGNDWQKKFLRPENPKGKNHPDSKNKKP
ncbi:RHS repeat-associated protein [Chitinophaga ginsengisoli]|uniref:RHS repeat-associated protein n=1 Tax=Chitinophaga ginsengisoli TaxID=363837 RepID=A0A2P8F7S9_9BACT|nr:RHS repeat-associated protein [Chitinophaga ginsengisoli]